MKEFALIGVSGYGAIYLREFRALAEQKKIRLAAVVIRNPDKVRGVYEELLAEGVQIFPSDVAMYEQLKGKLDLVGIPTAINCHEAMMNRALDAGASVMLEKPVAGSLEEVDRMIAAEKRYPGQFVAVGFQHSYGKEFQDLQRRIIDGEFGRIRQITVAGVWPRNDAYYCRNNWAGKQFAADGTPVWDSPVNNAFAHFLNISLFLSAAEAGKSAAGKLLHADLWRARPEIETFDSCKIELMANGVLIRNFFSHTGRENINPVIRLEGENGFAEWRCGDKMYIYDRYGRLQEEYSLTEPHPRMFQSVFSRLNDPEAFTYSLTEAGNHAAIVEELKKIPVKDVNPSLIERRKSDGQFITESVIDPVIRGWKQEWQDTLANVSRQRA